MKAHGVELGGQGLGWMEYGLRVGKEGLLSEDPPPPCNSGIIGL